MSNPRRPSYCPHCDGTHDNVLTMAACFKLRQPPKGNDHDPVTLTDGTTITRGQSLVALGMIRDALRPLPYC